MGYGPPQQHQQRQQQQQQPSQQQRGHPPSHGGGDPAGYGPFMGGGGGVVAGGPPPAHPGAPRPAPMPQFDFGAMAAAVASTAATAAAASGGMGPQAAIGAQLLRQMVPGAADAAGPAGAAAAFSHQTARMSAAARLPKYYFAVTNGYVLRKLLLVLFPFRHRSWRRRQLVGDDGDGAPGEFLPPREDVNAPDLYIPVMAFVTYVLLVAFVHGTQARFRPDLMASTGTLGVVVLGLEVLAIKLCLYLVNARPVAWLDIVAFRGYKFVGVVLAMMAGFLHRHLYSVVLMGSAFSMGLFLMRSHRGVVLSRGDDVDDEGGGVGVRRNYFLLGLLVLQFPIYWALGVKP